MDWIKTIIIDLIVTAVIIVAVTTDLAWARWAVVIYTPIMLILKIVALVGGSFTKQFKPRGPEAPAWVLHLLYAANVVALGLASWWITAAQWLAIWIISYIEWRQAPSSSTKE